MRKAFVALLVAAVLVTTLAVSVQAQTFYQRFGNLWAITLRSTGALTVGGDATVGGALATTGASTAASYVATGKVQAGTFVVASVATTATVVADGTLSPAGTYQPITAAGAVGTSSITLSPPGTLLYLVNVGSNTITFTDTGTLVLGGNLALGAGDTGLLVSNGVNWYQVSTANN